MASGNAGVNEHYQQVSFGIKSLIVLNKFLSLSLSLSLIDYIHQSFIHYTVNVEFQRNVDNKIGFEGIQ